MWLPPTAMATAGPGSVTGAAAGRAEVVPSPSSPVPLEPQVQTTPELSSAAANAYPPATSTALVMPGTCIGVMWSFVVPSPS